MPRSGVRASALRFYEKQGLITSVGRVGLRRQFSPDVLERVALIVLGRDAGLTLDEIGRMVAVDGSLRVDRTLLTEKAEAIDDTIRRLTSMRDGLRHAAACKAKDHMRCPKFRRLLGIATSRRLHGARTVRHPRR
ncbi:MAG: helix-turn-helix domain-containing protein [Thioalkalivibrio sp.]|nr:helix-turn-helix domain-containing protein [Thioalkalivibrio sp.]